MTCGNTIDCRDCEDRYKCGPAVGMIGDYTTKEYEKMKARKSSVSTDIDYSRRCGEFGHSDAMNRASCVSCSMHAIELYKACLNKKHAGVTPKTYKDKPKVEKQHMDKLPSILAVDFDGTLVHDDYPLIGKARTEVFDLVRTYIHRGWKVILWTCRDHEWLASAVDYCRNQGLEFDAVNENIKEVKEMFDNDTRKVFANIYIDDKFLFVEGVNNAS